MGRGDDKEATPAIPRKRNPFRQEIAELDKEELEDYRQEIKKQERAIKIKAAKKQKDNVAIPDEAKNLATANLLADEVMERRKEYLSQEFSKIPSMEKDFSPVRFIAQRGGLIKEDYQVEVSSKGGEIIYRVHCPAIKEEKGFLTYEDNWQEQPDRGEMTVAFLPGEEDQAQAAVEGYISEKMTVAQERAKKAFAVQERLEELLRKEGLMSFDPNSPAYGLLDRAGVEVFANCRLKEGSYPEYQFQYNSLDYASPALGLLADQYDITTREILRGPGMARYWSVNSANGQSLASGEATGLTEAEIKQEASRAIEEAVEKSLEDIREEHKIFKEREEIFKGLEARVYVRGLTSSHSQEYINLASGAGPIKNLKRKEMGDGYTAIVGEQTYRMFNGHPGDFSKKDSELLFVFKDGKLESRFTEGLTTYSEKAAGKIGRFLPGLRKRLLLSRAKKAIANPEGFQAGLVDN